MSRRLVQLGGIGLACLATAAVSVKLDWLGAGPPPRRDKANSPDLPRLLPKADPGMIAEASPTLGEAAEESLERRLRALASELAEMRTERPEELVRVIDQAARSRNPSAPVTLLLAIAHAETRGNILEVSEAGAVGLAQTTPIAYLQEDYAGPVYITADYLVGARTYLAKKPLADAERIATIMIETGDTVRAKTLLQAAMKLRREGFEDLELLRPFSPRVFFTRLEQADARNVRMLRELRDLLQRDDRRGLVEFRERVRRDYVVMRRTQRQAWKRYQQDLTRRRDEMLEKHFQIPAAVVRKDTPYEASEYLGRELDERFSATRMAQFLVHHLERKAGEAQALVGDGDDLEEVTAALYNGGSQNVKRILVGLISYLPETDRYKKKVPETRRRLDRRLAETEPPKGASEADGVWQEAR